MQNQSNLIIEDNVLDRAYTFGNKFSMPTDFIIYFEKENNIALNTYIRNNYENIRSMFSLNGFRFIYAPFLTTAVSDIDKLIDYYFPQLSYYEIPQKVKSDYGRFMFSQGLNISLNDIGPTFPNKDYTPLLYDYSNIIKFIGYKGNYKSGFTLFNTVVGVSNSFYVQNNDADFISFFK